VVRRGRYLSGTAAATAGLKNEGADTSGDREANEQSVKRDDVRLQLQQKRPLHAVALQWIGEPMNYSWKSLFSLHSRMALASAALLTGAIVCSTGCASVDAGDGEANGNDDPLVAETNRLWPNAKSIPVCFLNSDGTDQYARQIRDLASSEYAKVGLCFSGWNRCTTSSPCPAIRINIGRPVDGGAGAAGQSAVGPAPWECKNNHWSLWLAKDQIDWATIHEFGHAIGAEHEQGRTDNPGTCAQQAGDVYPQTSTTKYFGTYDPNSVMNYCSKRNRLSPQDISALKSLYKTSGAATCGGTTTGGGTTGGGTCTNSNANCASWAAAGECKKNPNYMLTSCCAACKGR
jgi:hypothetical protein